VYCPAGTTVGSFKDEYEVIKSMRWYDRIGGKVLLPANHYAIPERLSLCRSSGIIAVSEVVKRQMLRISEGCAYRIRVIHNGYEPKIIDTRHGGRTSQRAPRVGPGIEVICVGRLSPVKNLGHLIRAWALVKASPKRLRIVGSGGQMQKLKALADELGLSENVDFMGQRMDVPQLLHEADVFVLPSLSESFGTAVVEAMGAGLPCITVRNVEGISEVGASGEANLNEVTGFCVDPLDPEDLARRIDYLADHPDKRIEMGKAAQERAYSRFTWEHAARQYLRFACDLTGGK
jgi:glycosyltransferase involved in cell wall biosynthesis